MPDKTDNAEQLKQKILSKLKDLARHKHVRLVNKGNAAIFCALYIAKKVNPKAFILIPDQGGWISYKTYPKILGFEIKTVKTNRGLIDLIDLEKKIEGCAAFIVPSLAGYFAKQPIKYISKICKENNCLLIEDATGGIGDPELANGECSDIIVASFGRWKIINNKYGGFISTNNKEFFEAGKSVFSLTNFYEDINLYRSLLEKINNCKRRLQFLYDKTRKLKKELDELGFKVLHENHEGINVLVKPLTHSQKEKLIKYLNDKKLEYIECPRYDRVEEDAISIEVKRLEEITK